MNFSPEYLSTLIIRPLRYLFSVSAPESLRWDEDPMKSNVEIDTVNNLNKIKIQAKPRVMVSRGQYSVNPVGLTDNMARGIGPRELRGAKYRDNMFFIQGVAQIMIQARNEGTCEKLTNLVQHYLSWSGPILADTYGFKGSFLPMNVSSCTPDREDTEIFSCTINIPWMKEEHWTVTSGNEIKIKEFLLTLTNEDLE